MVDRYENFAQLSAENEEGRDFRVRHVDREAETAIIAPHGGTIEPETAEIAEVIAAEEFSFYAFEALQDGLHGDFHITSHRFDESRAIDLVARSSVAIAIHGRKDDGTDTVWMGGRATALRDAIGKSLRDAGFDAAPNTRLPGVHALNICNRTKSGKGVQLELSRSFRRRLAREPHTMDAFAEAIRGPIRSRMKE